MGAVMELGDEVKAAYLYCHVVSQIFLVGLAFLATYKEMWIWIIVCIAMYLINDYGSTKRWISWAGKLND